jgi:tetratricopeptide (TPR) repeat protein
MLTSKFKKNNKTFRATKIFTDRQEPKDVFKESLNAFLSNLKKGEIIVYYGVGGIGKTKLIKELYGMTDDAVKLNKCDGNVNKIHISLDVYDYSNPVNVLIAIRKQLKIDCGLFDYALLQYSAKTRNTVEDISRKLSGIDGPLLDVINELMSLGMGSVSVPANVLRKSVEIIKDINLKRTYKDEIAEIENYNESEIYQRLPYYLGLSVCNAYQKGKKHIFFFDSYESLALRMKDTALIEDSEEWLKEFFLSCENALFVVASREKIKWYEDNEGWNEFLNQHILERLAEEDSYYFLQKVPIAEDEIKKAIVTLSQGIPLYLDMCVDIYEREVNSGGIISEKLFNINSSKIISRYIRHLNDFEKQAIMILSVIDFFDKDFAEYLLKSDNLPFSAEEVMNLFDKSIFVELDEIQKYYKIDESVGQHILGTINDDKKNSVISNALNYVSDRLKNKSDDAFKYFEQLYHIIILNSRYFKLYINELIEIIVTLVDMGYWVEIHNVVKYDIQSEDEYIKAFCIFAELLYLRRSAKIKEAKSFLANHVINPSMLGKYKYLYDFLKIHIEHLSGNYDFALEQYKLLKEQIDLIKENVDSHTYYTIHVKYIDLLFLKGHFKTALKLINELADNDRIQFVDKAEILRVRGHIYRFNFKLKEAADIYNSALESAIKEKNAAFEGKIYNNLAETYCYSNPLSALKYAEKSIEINERIDSKIELGKTYAAVSTAYSLLNQYEKAIEFSHKAIELQKETGYTSGILFGEISLCIANLLSKKAGSDEIENHLKKIDEIINSINVYHFLTLPLFIITNNAKAIENLMNCCEWLEFEETKNEISKYFPKVNTYEN